MHRPFRQQHSLRSTFIYILYKALYIDTYTYMHTPFQCQQASMQATAVPWHNILQAPTEAQARLHTWPPYAHLHSCMQKDALYVYMHVYMYVICMYVGTVVSADACETVHSRITKQAHVHRCMHTETDGHTDTETRYLF